VEVEQLCGVAAASGHPSEAVIAKLELECAAAAASSSSRDRLWRKRELAEKTPRLAKAREIYALLTGTPIAATAGAR
jgi:hypothetical protein